MKELSERQMAKKTNANIEAISAALKETKKSFVPDWSNCWLADELRQELAREGGRLEVSSDVRRECDTIVHREFGHTKRLSEQEKKQLSQILRERTQLTTNVWQARLTDTNSDRTQEGNLLESKQDMASLLRDDVWRFVEANAKRVPEGHVVVSKQTSRASLMVERKGSDVTSGKPLDSVKTALDQLKKIVNGSLLAAEWLVNERKRVLRQVLVLIEMTKMNLQEAVNGSYM